VLLKVVPLKVTAENGRTLTTYGILDSASVGSMITSNVVEKLELQGVPENVSISTVTQRDQAQQLRPESYIIQGQIPDQLSKSRQPVLPSVSLLDSEGLKFFRPLMPKSTGFVSLATPQ